MKKTKQIKSIIALLMAVMMSVNVLADIDFTVGSICYRTTSSTTVKVISPLDDSKYSGNITIPSTVTYSSNTYTVTEIGYDAFSGCTDLTGVTIPSSVTMIDMRAFQNSGLTSITIPNSVTLIGTDAFSDCEKLTNVIIPNSVKTIDIRAFKNSGLTSITIPGTVSTIGTEAFARCTNLETATIETGVVEIATRMFDGCTNLTKVTLPNTVSKIVQESFFNCSSLDTLICPRTNPPTTGVRVFNGCPDTAKVIVPCGAKSNYNTSPWSSLTIVEDCEAPPVVEVNVTTEEVIDIKRKSATLKGKVQTTADVVSRGFQYREVGTTTASTISTGVSTESFSCTPTDLTPQTLYEFRAFAVVDSDTTWGAWESFTTLYLYIQEQYETNLTTNSATLNATVETNVEVSAKGFQYKTTEGGTYKTIDVMPAEEFICNLTELNSNTEYTFRAFAVDDNDTVFGDETTFKTLKEGIEITVTTEDATDITAHSATLHGKIETTADVTAKGFQYRIAMVGIYEAQSVNVTEPSLSITYNLTGLDERMEYTFRAFAVVDNDTIGGEWKSFVTSEDSGIEDVVTEKAISIYPNPAQDFVTIEGKGEVVITNSLGQVVKTLNNPNHLININIRDWEKGIYYIKIGNITKKLLVE